jgi:hypothetical protein
MMSVRSGADAKSGRRVSFARFVFEVFFEVLFEVPLAEGVRARRAGHSDESGLNGKAV